MRFRGLVLLLAVFGCSSSGGDLSTRSIGDPRGADASGSMQATGGRGAGATGAGGRTASGGGGDAARDASSDVLSTASGGIASGGVSTGAAGGGVAAAGGASSGGAGGASSGGAGGSPVCHPALYVVLDQSASMSCSISGGTRWDAVKSGLRSFLQGSAAPKLKMGLGYFGTNPSSLGSSCTSADYVPDVEIGPTSTTAQAIEMSLDAHGPVTDTPTLPALQAGIAHAGKWQGQHPGDSVAVVLVTDGVPNACGTNAEVASAAKSAFDGLRIYSYVVGILSPGSSCFLDPNQPSVADLDTVAASGGTGRARVVDTTSASDAAASFASGMESVAADVLSRCGGP